MSNRRVVVTGIGVISAIGSSKEEFWSSLKAGCSGIGPIESVDTSGLGFHNAAEVKTFDPTEHFDRRATLMLDRFSQFALVAAREALVDVEPVENGGLGPKSAVILGSGIGGQMSNEAATNAAYAQARRVHPLTIARTMPNAAASHISMEYGVRGPAFTIASACSSANHALGYAFSLVRTGMVDLAIAGGSEAPLAYGCLKAWDSMRVVAPDTCRPFSADRRGMVLGEGAGILILESLDSALGRGAAVHAEIVGFGMSSDAYHITTPSIEGPAAAMRGALTDAELQPGQIDYINTHGTATNANDRAETAAIRQVFGAHASRLAVSSTKSMHGHPLGAAGALEAIATSMTLANGVIPPTANYREHDPECDLDVVPNEARSADVEYALSNSFAFGGLNAVLAFRKWNGQ